jgi:uncharacterized protein (TIGR03437 family)
VVQGNCIGTNAPALHPTQVEFVGSVPSFPWLTQVVLRFPDGVADKPSALVSITVHGVESNKVLVTLKSL